ncbi:DUF2357 domain-containing protein [Thermococcus sp.]
MDEGENILSEVPLKGKEGGKWEYCLKSREKVIVPRGEMLYLFEWREYRIIGKRAFTLRVGNEVLEAEKINENTYIVTFQFKNYIGRTNIGILEGDEGVQLDFKNFEVLSDKIGRIYKTDPDNIEELIQKHEELYNLLVKHISEKSLSLPFSMGAPTAFGAEEAEGPMNELFAYHFLVDNGERITSAYEEIIKNPHRTLVEEEEWLDFWEVSEVNGDTVASIITHPEYLTKAESSAVALSAYLGAYVPSKVLQRVKYESFDTHENRFAKHFLNELVVWGERAKGAIEKSRYLTKEQKGDAISKLTSILGELKYHATSDIFDDVGEMTIFPYTSQVLLKREGYRDLLQLWQEFRSYSPFFDEMQKAIDSKDIAKLYEYWAFFRLVEELGDILGWKSLRVVIEPTGELSESGDVYATFDNGWRLYYNKRLTPRRWSYSVTLRPDYSLFNGNPKKKETKIIGVFDAKFKLDVVDEKEEIEKLDEIDEEVQKTGSYTTWAKLEDIYKMHTYRDALGCRFAVVVYPGRKSVFFDVNKGKIESFKVTHILTGNLEGVGYLRLIPEVEIW